MLTAGTRTHLLCSAVQQNLSHQAELQLPCTPQLSCALDSAGKRRQYSLLLTMKHAVVRQEVSAVLQAVFLIQAPVTHPETFCSPKTATLQTETE